MTGMMTEKTPHPSIGITHIFKIYRAISITEREVGITAIIKAFFASERNYICSIHTLHLWAVNLLKATTADANVRAFLLLWELTYATQIGMSANAVVWNAQRHPHSPFSVGSFAVSSAI